VSLVKFFIIYLLGRNKKHQKESTMKKLTIIRSVLPAGLSTIKYDSLNQTDKQITFGNEADAEVKRIEF
jgi:hypothetical protein